MSRAPQTSCHRAGSNVTWALGDSHFLAEQGHAARPTLACPLPAAPPTPPRGPCSPSPHFLLPHDPGTRRRAGQDVQEGTAASVRAMLLGSGPAPCLRCHCATQCAGGRDPKPSCTNQQLNSFILWTQVPLADVALGPC